VSPNTRGTGLGHLPLLVIAAQYGHTRVVKLLLENGADHTLVDDSGCTAVQRAAQQGHVDCVRLLIDAGSDVKTADSLCGNTPLIVAVVGKHLECARLLLPISDLGHYSRQGTTAVHTAVITASKECFELLLPHVDVDVRTIPGTESDGTPVLSFQKTALILACQRGLFDFFSKILLKEGADLMARDSRQRMALYYAAFNGHLACVTHLLGRPDQPKMTPAEMDAVDAQGATALHSAAHQGHERVCAALLEAGASLSARTPDGATPLLLAQQEHPTKASLLTLLSGAGPEHPPGTVCDHCGKTAEQAGIRCLKVCGFCQNARYCCEACAKADWRRHKRARGGAGGEHVGENRFVRLGWAVGSWQMSAPLRCKQRRAQAPGCSPRSLLANRARPVRQCCTLSSCPPSAPSTSISTVFAPMEAALWSFPVAELSPESEWTKIGEGSFGNVWRAHLLGTPVAVKVNLLHCCLLRPVVRCRAGELFCWTAFSTALVTLPRFRCGLP